MSEVKNFKDEKETIAIAKTPGHRKNRKVIESLPLAWSIKVHSKPNLHRIILAYVGKSCQMINTVAQVVLGRNQSLSVEQVLRSARIWAWQRKYKHS